MIDRHPKCKAIRSHLTAIVQAELKQVLRRLNDQSLITRQTLNIFAEQIVDGVLEKPAAVVSKAEKDQRQLMIQTLYDLFEVESV